MMRAGSTLALTKGTVATTPTEPRALNDVMAQLRSIGTNDPAIQAKLMEDMQRTDPSLWPLLIQTYRSSLAYQDQTRVAAMTWRVASPATSVQLHECLQKFAAVALRRRSWRSARTGSRRRSPWTALHGSAAGVADQEVVLVAAARATSPRLRILCRPLPPPTTVAQTEVAKPASATVAPAPVAASGCASDPAIAHDRGNTHCFGGCSPPRDRKMPMSNLPRSRPRRGDAPNLPVDISSAIAALEKQTQTPVRDAAGCVA